MRLHWTDDSAFGLPIPRKTSAYWREYERSPPKSGAGAQEAEDKKSLVCSTFQRECWRGYLIIIFKTLRKECEEERVKPFSESHSRKMGSNRLRLEHRKFSVKKKKKKKKHTEGSLSKNPCCLSCRYCGTFGWMYFGHIQNWTRKGLKQCPLTIWVYSSFCKGLKLEVFWRYFLRFRQGNCICWFCMWKLEVVGKKRYSFSSEQERSKWRWWEAFRGGVLEIPGQWSFIKSKC